MDGGTSGDHAHRWHLHVVVLAEPDGDVGLQTRQPLADLHVQPANIDLPTSPYSFTARLVEVERDDMDGVPLLMHLPVLGHLFKSTNKIRDRRELLIFITPRIIES